MTRMKRITREEEYRVVWENDVPEFENPETLIHYLRRHAPGGTYRIRGLSVWATDAAIRAAVRGLEKDIEEEDQRRPW